MATRAHRRTPRTARPATAAPSPTAVAISVAPHRLSQPDDLDHEIAALANRQHGRVARQQLLDLGLGEGAIEYRRRQGRLVDVRRGVYAVGHRIHSQRATWMEAVLAAGPDATLSHRGAAGLWQLLRSGAVEITVPRALHRRRGLVVHRALLPPDEVTVRDGIPVTTPSRTLLDLAAVLRADAFETAAHEAEVRRLLDERSLASLLDRYPHRAGARRARAYLAARVRARSAGREEIQRLLVAVLDAGALPRPLFDRLVEVEGVTYEVDCMWPQQRLIVELDGWASHGTRRAYERDRARDRALAVAGWRVIRITWEQLRDDPEGVARDLRALLA